MKKEKETLKLEVPEGETEVLLHTCCAPCSGAIIECLLQNGIRPTIFYSNSNIYPLKEYLTRRDECTKYAEAKGLKVVEDEYDHERWLCIASGLESEPERGGRCLKCFRFRLERAAKYASENGYKVLTTTLASSRWKNIEQINAAGEYACSLFPGLVWWTQNWRKGGLQERRNEILQEMDFYNQEYCGCEFSLR